MNTTITVGDKVIALTVSKSGKGQPREIGKEYEVAAIKHCLKCGSVTLNLKDTPTITASRFRCNCDQVISSDGLFWTNASHFCKVANVNYFLDLAVAEENYSTAIILRDYLKSKVS